MITTESKYRKFTSEQRDKESKTLSSNLSSLKMFNHKINNKLKEGNYTIDDLMNDLHDEIRNIEWTLNEINEVEINKFKLFYPDPCNENECAMCGKKYEDHFHHDKEKKHRPFCNNF